MQGYSKLLENQYILKKYNDNSYKLILFKRPIKNSGFEEKDPKPELIFEPDREKSKSDNNISRVRSKIWEYAECNDFTYFITLTLDKKKRDRYDLQQYIKDLSQYIRNNRRLKGVNIQYLLIPEQHQDGAWHFHGLISGIDPSDLEEFSMNDYLPYKVRTKIIQGRNILKWVPYAKKFGYVTVEKINNKSAIAKYITKYIKKDIGSSVKELNKKSYYVSRGLNTSQIQKKGTFPTSLRKAHSFNFENEFVAIKDLNKDQYLDLMKQL